MGYDMYWSQPPEGEAEAVEAATREFHAACKERDALPKSEHGTFNRERADQIGDWDSPDAYDGQSDRYRAAQAAVHAAYEAIDEAHASYFRLNISGMVRYAGLMAEIGMIFDDDPAPPWPKSEEFGITDDDWEAWKYPAPDAPALLPDVLARCEKFDAAQQRILDWHGRSDTPGIPSRKFSSNDSWHVLPAECQAALRIYADKLEQWGEAKMHALVAGRTNSPDYWAAWLRWLDGASRHAGFEVR